MEIIKIIKGYELGNILAQIRKSQGNRIILQVSGNSSFFNNKEDYKIVKSFAEKLNKEINIQDTEKLERIGFIAGEDISRTDNPPQPKIMKKKKIKGVNRTSNFLKDKKLFIAIAALILFLGLTGVALSAAYFYIPKAEISLKIDSQVFTGTKETIVSLVSQEVNEDEKTIPGTLISLTVTDSMTEIPTGEKEIGDKATGKIEIFNKTIEEIKITAGTIVTFKSNEENDENSEVLEYVINEDIIIPAKTEEEITDENGEIKKAEVYGSQKIVVTATNLGEKYNIVDSKYDINVKEIEKEKILTEIEEKPKGGSTKKITVITKKDMESLEEKLTKKLKEKAKKELENKIIDSQELLEGAIEYSIKTKSFDKEVDEEADKFELSMEIEARGVIYSRQDLLEVLNTLIKDLVPNNYSVAENTEEFNIVTTVKEVTKNETGELQGITITNKIQSYVVPKIDENQIKKDLKGLNVEDAKKYLEDIANIKSAEIDISPNLPTPLKRMPKIEDNITIKIETERTD